jgi:hypothetical protein
MKKGANISDCGTYRYFLTRDWDETKPLVMYIGINPNTADDKIDNPTITRLIHFSKEFGYGGMIMTNLFAYRSPKPDTLLTVPDPVGPKNDVNIFLGSTYCKDVVFMWGDSPTLGREKRVIKMFPNALCFGLSKKGNPKHCLYLKSGSQLELFKKIT